MNPERGQPTAAALDLMIVIAAVIIGAFVRLVPVLSTDFPVNDGGLFASIIDDLVAHGPLPPETLSYNHAQIPFAYPPAGFYLGAGLVSLGLPTLSVMQFVPVALAIMLVPAWFLLARELVSPRLAAVATVFFALMPRSYEWLVAGGGLTRGLGLLFALIGLRFAILHFRTGERTAGAFAGVLMGLTVLSHPEAAAFAAASACLFAWRERARPGRILAIGAVALAVSSPWLVYVLLTFGPAPLVSAGGSRTGSYLPVLQRLLELRFTQEAYVALGSLLGAVGMFLSVTSGRVWLLVWSITIFVLTPSAAATLLMLPWSIAAAIAAVELAVPRVAPAWRAPVVASGLAIMTISSVWSVHLPSTGLLSLSSDVRAAMAWVAGEVPEQTSALVVSGAPWAADATAEWYPYLTGRGSVATVQGHEFTTDWAGRRDAANDLAACGRTGAGCLEELIASEWPDVDIVVIPKGRVPGGPDSEDCCPGVRATLRSSADVIYDGPGATIYRIGS